MLNRHHGGNDLSLDICLDFSANLNPLGMPEKVREAVIASAAEWEKYPDPFCSKLRGKLSGKLGVPAENIVCGNGADDLIYRIVSALRPKKALICAPAFSEYRKALEEYGCAVNEHFLYEEKGFALTESIFDRIAGNDMLILASPNNPTGQITGPELLAEIAGRCRMAGVFFLCDESFIGFSSESERITALNFLNESTIVLRSFTKLFAMAGLRLGYAVCGNTETAEKISRTGQYWSVSAPAQAAGIAALDEKDYIKRTTDLIKAEREYLAAELADMGVKVFPSDTDFILFKARTDLGELLLERKILIRSCAGYSGLDRSFFRAAVRTVSENRQLIAAIRRIMNG
ncbi:MAG: aminotransferase class I/II-fold pyridoxal phosphate-dependent enzyme [Ruminococcus sp.]|uniref:pyridoxal phosphate-dependent aminotransferase n=1 Tax=Ruminococcus sp. TaxID=41978 RepID=UPI0025DB3679|nr:histidinol-phosphate transaminase [Ruminococcus sp.]MBR5683627.1 aminotransferase class I/II-fold pyridoxal phosphate-dependent enzyme [Ruminococcus sp.]